MLRRIPLLKIFATLVVASGLISVCLMIAGRRVAVGIVFDEINSMATLYQENDNELIADFEKQLAATRDTIHREDIQSVIDDTKSKRSGFVCIDDATKVLFSSEQQTVLEKSLKRYYSNVIWGKRNIPQNLMNADGEPKNGFVMGYSIQVYPGVVKIRTHSWSGFLSGGGHTNVYIWKGLGFRFHKRSELWIS